MRRSSLEIIIEVLEIVKNGDNKSNIVYKANLNFKLADKYLDLLVKNGLMEYRLGKYITTEKGKIFSEKAKEITLNLGFESSIT